MTLRIKSRKKKIRLENLPVSLSPSQIESIALTLAKKIDAEVFARRYAPVKEVLTLVGTGAFVAASFALPTLPIAMRPFLQNPEAKEAWKRFNVPYLRRTLRRLAKQKLVEIGEEDGKQVVRITDSGGRRILRYALEELVIQKPRIWDGTWWLVSYDIPKEFKHQAAIFREYLRTWRFYPLHESTFLHAYPCQKEVAFLREYLGIGEYVRIFRVAAIENDRVFREFFGV